MTLEAATEYEGDEGIYFGLFRTGVKCLDFIEDTNIFTVSINFTHLSIII